MERLTPRETECVALAARGLKDKQIRITLGIGSERTVSNHLANAYTKLGVSDRRAAATALGIGYSDLPIPIHTPTEEKRIGEVSPKHLGDLGDGTKAPRRTLYQVYAGLGRFRTPSRWGGSRIWVILLGALALTLFSGAVLSVGLVVSGVIDVIHDWRNP